MKKIITMIVVIAMIASLAMTGVSAAGGHYVWNHSGDVNYDDPWGETTMIGFQSPLTTTIRFKTDVNFSKIMFPMVWNQPQTVITLKLYQGETLAATAQVGPIFNEAAKSGDVRDVEFDLGKKVLAGEYTMELSVEEGFYSFFAYAAEPLSEEYIEYEMGHAMFGLYTTDNGAGFVAFATEVTPPPTGDAAIVATAVLAIAAMGVTVVLVKKKVR